MFQLERTGKYIKTAQDNTDDAVEANENQPSNHYKDGNVTIPSSSLQVSMSSVKVDKKERETMTSPRFNSGNIVDVPSAVESESVKALNNQLNQV